MGRITPHGELLGFGPILACLTVPNNSPWGIIKPKTPIIPHVKKISCFFVVLCKKTTFQSMFIRLKKYFTVPINTPWGIINPQPLIIPQWGTIWGGNYTAHYGTRILLIQITHHICETNSCFLITYSEKMFLIIKNLQHISL